MKYLGIDFGEARIGLALSDSSGRMAFPKNILLNRGNTRLAEQIKKLISEEHISEIIVGLPLSLDGKETKESGDARVFGKWLADTTTLPVEFENEIFTTKMATHPGVVKGKVDAAAAALILQSYLDKHITHI
jgi:putative Holliday junction resolvase